MSSQWKDDYDEIYREGFIDAISTIRDLIYQGYEADLLSDWIEDKLVATENELLA